MENSFASSNINNGNHHCSPANNGIHHSSSPLVAPTLGHHLARRLVQIGVSDIFSVPGDSNLTLLDCFIEEPGLNLIGCCSELNAGYAADGYARARGVGAFVVTFTVGGLSILNAVAGAYSEDLPIVCIVGAPNSNDYGSNKILHHTIGLPDFSQELRCFQTVTCHQAVIDSLDKAREHIDRAIRVCLEESKPVYISISGNLMTIPHSSFLHQSPLPLISSSKITNQTVLEAAVEAASEILNKATKPVLVGGPKLRPSKASNIFIQLSNTCGYATAVMPSAKGLVPENLPLFMGTYWGVASSACCAEIVETADASLFAGPVFDDISTVGESLMFNRKKSIIAQLDRVIVPDMPVFEGVMLKDFLKKLGKKVHQNTNSYENYKRLNMSEGQRYSQSDPKEALRVNVLFKHVQKMLVADMAVIAEVGDSWFHSQKLKLPQGCGFESQLLYASIGWSVGATLGYAQALPNKRVIACVGDGSFQMSPQDVSTMLRCGHNSIIVLINNGGYTIEVEIHDGPYNVINNWNYTALIDALDNGQGRCWTAKVHCEEELKRAIKTATEDKRERLCFIEAVVHRDDTSKELLQFVCRLAAANGRRPSSCKCIVTKNN